jgi:penicillin-binding protein-related factor A (putative recombinase)
MSAQQSEKSLQDSALVWLRERGGVWLNLSHAQHVEDGIPDVLGLYMGRFIAFEFKKPNEYPVALLGCSAAQIDLGEKILDNGGVWYAVDSLKRVQRVIALVEEKRI